MNEEVFNMQIRKFLKKVGIQSQREIENKVRESIRSGLLSDTEKLHASVLLKIPAAGIEMLVEDEIKLV